MYISMNWIKDFVDLEGLDIKDIVNQFTLSCAEVEDIIEKGKDIKGVITARIEKVENHPNSQKLHLLKVNTGKELVDVVCGAPNVKEGMITAFATMGAQVGDIVIAKAKVAGYESCGMCCSAKELGISDDHSGIMEFCDTTPLGLDIKSILPIEDTLIEVDNKSLTNRPDMWGHYGIAREIAAITGRQLKEYIVDKTDYSKLPDLNVKVSSPSCYRYSALRVENVTQKVSSMAMQIRLYYCGMRAISLLADLTNYIMLELGQPMHSFDGAKVQSIVVKDLEKDTPFVTLDQVERVLPEGTMVIETQDGIGAIAGVMGGLSSEIEEDTHSAFLESANFEAVKVRKTATSIGLRSESSARYEKSLDPEMTSTALRRYVYLLKQVDDEIKVVSNLTDVYAKKYPHIVIDITKRYIDQYTGIEIPQQRVVEILTSLGFGVKENKDVLTIDVPSWRATKDISIKADIVEEIARVYGYDNIVSLPAKQPVEPQKLGLDVVRDYDVKYVLADKYHMHEIHSYVWEDAVANQSLGIETKSYIRLVNSLQKDNDDIRSSMLPTIIRAIDQNKRYSESFGLFEVGHVVTGTYKNTNPDYHLDQLAKEEKYLGLGWMMSKEDMKNGLIQAKDCILYIVQYLLNIPVTLSPVTPEVSYLAPINAYKVSVAGQDIGIIGLVHPKVQQKIDKNSCIVVAELNMSVISTAKADEIKYQKVSKYPTTTLDFSFALDKNDVYGSIEKIAHSLDTRLSYTVELVDIFYKEGSDVKSYTLRYSVTSLDHTLSSAEIEEFHKLVITTFEANKIYLKNE